MTQLTPNSGEGMPTPPETQTSEMPQAAGADPVPRTLLGEVTVDYPGLQHFEPGEAPGHISNTASMIDTLNPTNEKGALKDPDFTYEVKPARHRNPYA